jgi:predicted AlkP superfamily pyrophosphatase or phosphodiesterase
MSRRIQLVLLCLMALAAGGPRVSAGVAPSGAPDRPALVVILAVDQMRTDYITRYGQHWTAGLRRLLDEGAWFSEAAYPYLTTVTCAGHATIGTGSVPARHGIIQNSWWDRATGRMITCGEDPSASVVSYGASGSGVAHTTHRLRVPTLADEMRAQLPAAPRVVSFSIKPRTAIMLAGRTGDIVTWMGPEGTWESSSAYSDRPVPFVEQFVAANPIEADFGKVWTRALPDDAYLHDAAQSAAAPPAGWTNTFPHRLRGDADEPDGTFQTLWLHSPWSDAYLARMAAGAVAHLKLGQGRRTDYLAVGFSALDTLGHRFGPHSHEVQDLLYRLDGTIGELLAELDRLVGRDRYVVALSADHGVAPIPEEMVRLGIDAGRINTREVASSVDELLQDAFGPGTYVATMAHTDFYFLPGVYERLRARPDILERVLEIIQANPGVWRVYRGEELRQVAAGDPVAMSASLSYYPGRSGDLIVVPRPYWLTATAATTHGTGHGYDARVPVVLMGPGIRAGHHLEPASPADIAPTLAWLTGVTLAAHDGRLLREALELPQRPQAPRTESRER